MSLLTLSSGGNDIQKVLPTSLGAMYAWFDTDDRSRAYQTTATTSPVVSFGQFEGRVDDKSSNNRFLTEGTAPPTYNNYDGALYVPQTNKLAAQAASDFTFLHNGTTYDMLVQFKFSIVDPLTYPSPALFDDKNSLVSNSVGVTAAINQADGTLTWNMGKGGGGKTPGAFVLVTPHASMPIDTNYHVLTFRYQVANPEVRIDGVAYPGTYTSTPSNNAASNLFTLGRLAVSAGFGLPGYIRRVWIFQGNLSAPNITAAEALIIGN